MNPFEMVVIIVLIAAGARVISRYHSAKLQRDPAQDADVARLRSDVEQLSRRVQTLERLATDPTLRLSDEIERLRDARG